MDHALQFEHAREKSLATEAATRFVRLCAPRRFA
jgi:hypothetical protein